MPTTARALRGRTVSVLRAEAAAVVAVAVAAAVDPDLVRACRASTRVIGRAWAHARFRALAQRKMRVPQLVAVTVVRVVTIKATGALLRAAMEPVDAGAAAVVAEAPKVATRARATAVDAAAAAAVVAHKLQVPGRTTCRALVRPRKPSHRRSRCHSHSHSHSHSRHPRSRLRLLCRRQSLCCPCWPWPAVSPARRM
jgi:hypothetical protein